MANSKGFALFGSLEGAYSPSCGTILNGMTEMLEMQVLVHIIINMFVNVLRLVYKSSSLVSVFHTMFSTIPVGSLALSRVWHRT